MALARRRRNGSSSSTSSRLLSLPRSCNSSAMPPLLPFAHHGTQQFYPSPCGASNDRKHLHRIQETADAVSHLFRRRLATEKLHKSIFRKGQIGKGRMIHEIEIFLSGRRLLYLEIGPIRLTGCL